MFSTVVSDPDHYFRPGLSLSVLPGVLLSTTQPCMFFSGHIMSIAFLGHVVSHPCPIIAHSSILRRRLDVDEIDDRGPRPAAAERDRRRRRMLDPHERHGDGGRCIVVGDAPVHGREVAWARHR